jgi:methyl-accepting chemotaxis protein
MKIKNTNTYSKIIILIFILSSISLVLFTSLLFYIKKQEQVNYVETKNQFKKDIFAIHKMEVLQNESYVNDIVYWDDFIHYLKFRNEDWFIESVATSLNTYNFDQLIVLDTNGNLVVKKSKNKNIYSDLDVTNSIKNIKLHKTFRFYEKTTSGFIEVIGSGIYNSTNSNKKFGLPKGYFFVVRKLDLTYFNKINEITNSRFIISENKSKENKKEISVSIEIPNSENKKFGYFVFIRNYNNNFIILNKIIYFITLLSFLNMLIYFLFIRKWINKPLNLVLKVLEENNSKAINNLIAYRGEFGYIGKLFKKKKNY